jgi:hypothetical protein
MSTEPLHFFTPVVGRLTHGSVTEKRSKDQDNRPIPPEDQRFEIGVAFQKAEIWPMITEQWYPYLGSALAHDQNALSRMQNWFQTTSGFSMKVTDGDKPNSRGQRNEHTAGCFVLWFNGIEFRTVGPSNEEIAPDAIKRGYYVQVAGNLKANGQPGDRAGIYLNGNIVRLVAEGDVIMGGMDADTAFGGSAAPAALPPGARPLGASTGAAGAFTPPGAPAPAATVPALPGVAPAPAGAAPTTASPTEMPGAAPHPAILAGPPPLPGT